MIRQPDKCVCFGGRCWKQFCPDRTKKAYDPHTKPEEMEEQPQKHTKGKVLTLSESLKELESNKDE